jgi:hypothetical protein
MAHEIWSQRNKCFMKTCPRCSRENEEEARNCRECGAEFEIPKKAIANEDQNISRFGGEPFSTRVKTFFWFAAWGGVVLIVLAINPAYFRAAFIFPMGLFALSPNGDGTGITPSIMALKLGAFIIGWVLYAVLSVIMFKAKSRGIFIATYVIFCILLLLNIGGCHRVSESMSGIQ